MSVIDPEVQHRQPVFNQSVCYLLLLLISTGFLDPDRAGGRLFSF